MRNLSNEDLEWLARPDSSGDDKRIVHIQDDFAIGLDGFRLHAINLDKIDKIEKFPIKDKVVDAFANSTTVENVMVNVRFLLDALGGMKSDVDYYKDVKLSISVADENSIAIRIDDGSKTAIIMCVKDESNESD
jgi:hypothetical protein